jgi:hypothetical protein
VDALPRGGSPTAAVGIPSATREPTATPQPTLLPEIEALLAPGPTFPAPERIYFEVGTDLWQYPPGGPATQVTRDLRIGPYAPSPDGQRVAIVAYSTRGTEQLAEVRIIGPSGVANQTISEPVSTPPAIVDLAWSWDGAAIAAAYDDGTIEIVPVPGNTGATGPFASELPDEPAAGRIVTDLTWAPTGAGLAYIAYQGRGPRSLLIAPRDGTAFPVVDGDGAQSRSVRAFAWLPGRGRIAYVDDVSTSASAPGSIFTIAPDRSARELLLSSGRFAPVAGIVDLSASPDGQKLALSVFTPDAGGRLSFHSLWLLTIDTGELARVPVGIAYRVTDLWWLSTGLVWRGVERSAPTTGDGSTYTGSEPFVLGLFDPATGQTTIVFQTALLDER